jgi:hypothetical protein
MIVMVLLHAGRPNGCISLLERYRVDGSPITSWEPTISGVALAPGPIGALSPNRQNAAKACGVRFRNGGHERFRTSDPYSVNVVLYP